MKTSITILTAIALLSLAQIANAGLSRPAPLEVDFELMQAFGDQYTARTIEGDTQYIGCGSRTFDFGDGFVFKFGFCQAEDSEGDTILCFTESEELIAAMRSASDFAFINFSWQDDGFGGAECTRVGFSTQSLYLPEFKEKKKDDDDSDDD